MDEGQALARRFALEVAETLVRREVAEICGTKDKRGAAERYAASAVGFEEHVRDFYLAHAQQITRKLGLSEHGAARYCDEQVLELKQGGIKVAETWLIDRAPVLAETALAEARGIAYSAPPRTIINIAMSAPVNAPMTVNVPKQEPPAIAINPTFEVKAELLVPEKKKRAVKIEYGKDGRPAALKEE